MKSYAYWIFLFNFIFALLTANFFNLVTNTFKSRPDWIVSKAKAPPHILSFNAERFRIDPIALAQGKLNLGVWHGHHEIVTKELFDIKKIKIWFKLDSEAVLYVFLKDKNGHGSGVRITNSKLFPSVWFELNQENQFVKKQFSSYAVDDSWQMLELPIDSLIKNSSHYEGPYSVGLRNEYKSAWVDEIQVYGSKDVVIFSDNFYFQTNYFSTVFVLVFTFFAILWALIYSFQNKKLIFSGLLVQMTLSGITILGWLSYYYIFSMNYPAAVAHVAPPTLEVKHRYRSKFVTDLRMSNQLENYTTHKGKSLKRVLSKIIFLGSSQTTGEGAIKESETWVNRTCHDLRVTQFPKLTCINLALKGSHSAFQLKLLHSQSLDPDDLVIINLGNNDTNASEFEKNIILMKKWVTKSNSKLLIIFEANDPQVNSVTLEENHQRLSGICSSSNNIVCFNMHQFLMASKHFDSGFMWNDHVHPSSYTQRIMSETITSVIELYL